MVEMKELGKENWVNIDVSCRVVFVTHAVFAA